MTIQTEDLINSICASLERITYIHPEDIPNMDLYMDQVTSFMESKLRQSMRNPEDDKILTKTMINNYAKNDLIPPPIKKKYSKEHILLLIFIYYYKGILSINDIQALLGPLKERFFSPEGNFSLEDIYNEVFSLEKNQIEELKQDLIKKYKVSEQTFADAPEKEQDFLRKFAFICELSFDVYVKKLLIVKIIDGMIEEQEPAKRNKKNK